MDVPRVSTARGVVTDAYALIRPLLRRTPLLPSPWLSAIAGRPVYLKAENLQETGSFKARGALNMLMRLDAESRARGVVTASAGNHGQAVAWAAARLGLAATIVLPVDAVPVKVERTRAWGARIVQAGQGYDAAHHHAETLARETGGVYVPAFDHPDVIAGQGTLVLDILEELPQPRLVVVPVGGGGLVAGVVQALREAGSTAQVVGVQSERTTAMHDALRAGHLVPVETPPTLADGLAGETSQTTLELCQSYGVTVELVPEEALLPAIGATLLNERLVIEGSAAVTIGAVQHGLLPAGDGPAVLVLSGGNVDPGVLAQALTAL